MSTAARNASGIEEDVIFLLAHTALIAFLFIEQAQSLHQEALRVQGRGLLLGLAIEVDLEITARPLQNFKDGCVARELSIGCVRHLAFTEVHLAFVTIFGKRKQTTLAAHF